MIFGQPTGISVGHSLGRGFRHHRRRLPAAPWLRTEVTPVFWFAETRAACKHVCNRAVQTTPVAYLSAIAERL